MTNPQTTPQSSDGFRRASTEQSASIIEAARRLVQQYGAGAVKVAA